MTTLLHSYRERLIAVALTALTLSACNLQTDTPRGDNKPTAPASGYAILTWVAPTQNVDGTPLSNLAGYTVRYGQDARRPAWSVNIPNPGTTTIRIEGLSAGTWYFTVAAYTNMRVESAPSVTASKTVQ